MPKFKESRTFAGKSADACFTACEAALVVAGFEVWKRRPMGWLLLARRSDPQGRVEANIACRPGAGALVSITLFSDALPDQALELIAGQILSATAAELG